MAKSLRKMLRKEDGKDSKTLQIFFYKIKPKLLVLNAREKTWYQ